MSLKHALLGFINYGPMTGYEPKKFFDTSVALFWQLTIDCGLKVHKAELDWTEEAIQKIKAADDSIFENEQHGYDGVNEVRTAMEALDRIKAAMPGALAGADTYLHAGSQGEKAITEEAVI